MAVFPGGYVWFPRALKLFHVVALVTDVCSLYCDDR